MLFVKVRAKTLSNCYPSLLPARSVMALVRFMSRTPLVSVHFVKAPASTLIRVSVALSAEARAALRTKGLRNNAQSAAAKDINRVKIFHAVFVAEKDLLERNGLEKIYTKRSEK